MGEPHGFLSGGRTARCVRPVGFPFFLLICSLTALAAYGVYAGRLLAQAPQAGRNVNMVAGTEWPGGDPFLQRQNEPSIAISTRNPQHLLAGANDYRTVDLPGIPGSEQNGDAWQGLFKSFDGGNTWTSTLLPGYPQDRSREGLLSPLKGYQAASDPTVRASTNGLFYYSGIVFNRGQDGGNVLFVARFIDNNNKEAGDSIQYIDTIVVNKRKKKRFVDKPWLAVDIPRANSRSCSIRVPRGDGTFSFQTFPGGNVYVSYTDAEGEDADSTRLMFTRSTDCGATWEKADTLSDKRTVNQGSVIAVDPNTGTVYVAWRQIFLPDTSRSAPHAIMIAKSTNGGISFGRPVMVAPIVPFDLGSLPASSTGPASTYRRFRTSSYPALAVDANPDPSRPGRVYLAWSESGRGPGGDARIVTSVSQDSGSSWSPAQVVDNGTARAGGHQIMPSMAFSAGKLMLVYYDFRGDLRPVPAEFVADPIHPSPPVWHTVDVRAAQADPANTPVFVSAQVSKYLHLLGRSGRPWQVQASSVNYPMFAQGTIPFMGDYIDIAAPAMIQDASGRWKFNTDPVRSPIFQSVWTDNRDVVPPPKPQNWTMYAPPGALGGTQSKFDPTKTVDACTPGLAGMRNQNIYTARITPGLVVGSPGNAKPLGRIQRAFVVYVENATNVQRSYRLTIAEQPRGGKASFLQFESRTSLDVTIARRSSIARTVFVTSTDSRASTKVNVVEIDAAGTPVSAGLQGSVVLNPDILNPDILNPDILNPDILNPDILNLEVSAPNIAAAVLRPDILNPDILNPDILNPDILNPDILNPDILNPDILNPDILNPDILNPDILNPDILNTDPDVRNADKSKLQINDVFWTIKNNGNTTSAFAFNLKFRSRPKGFKFQLLIYRVSSTPAVQGCTPVSQSHEQLVANIVNPDILNPDILNPDILNGDVRNASLFIAPGDSAKVQLRVFDLDKFDANVIQIKPRTSSTLKTLDNAAVALDLGLFGDVEIAGEPITAALVSQAVDTAAAQAGVTQPSSATTRLTVTTTVLPAGRVGSPFLYQLLASGGTAPLTWSVVSGSPSNLTVSPTGLISGTPTTAGTFVFTVQVTDSSNPQQVATQELTLAVAPPLGTAALVFVTAPAPCSDTVNPSPNCVRQNVALSPPVSVRAFSAAGAPVAGVSISIAIGLNGGGGTLSGTTTAVTDSNGVAAFGSLTLSQPGAYTLVASAAGYTVATTATFNVVGNVTVATQSLPDGITGRPYNASVVATGGIPPRTFSITAGALPPGLSLDETTGAISQTPTAPGPFSFDVRVTDAVVPQQTATRTLPIRISDPLQILTTSLPSGIVGMPYAQDVVRSGGFGPFTFTVMSGRLPDGLSLSPAGTISGTPTAADTFNFTVRVVDSSSPPQTAQSSQLSITVQPTLSIPPQALADGTAGQPFTQRLVVNGAIGNATWSTVPPNTSPAPGLTLNPNGTITGTPTSAGSFDFTARVEDSSVPPQAAQRSVTITIAAVPTTGYIVSTIPRSGGITEGGVATGQLISEMTDVAVDASGNLYIPSANHHKVYKVTTDGKLTTFAGTGVPGPAGDGGLATAAQLRRPQSVAFDASGNLFIADTANHRVRRVAPDGTITTVAGTGEYGIGQSGRAFVTPLASPGGLTFDASGNLYIAELGSSRIRKIDASGNISTVAGNGTSGFGGDGGPATSAQLSLPVGGVRLGFDASGNMYIPDFGNVRIRKVSLNGIITTIAGTGTSGNSADGVPASEAQIQPPTAVLIGAGGTLYFGSGNQLRKFTLPDGTLQTVFASVLYLSGGMTADQNGDLIVVTNSQYEVSRITPAGVVTTLAGRGLQPPFGVAADRQGNLFVADFLYSAIRKIDTGGNIHTIPTVGEYPSVITVDHAGNIYFISDHHVGKITTDGTLSTIAGTGQAGFSGDDGPAASAQLSSPSGVAVDFAGNVYIADRGNGRIRKVNASDRKITTVAGPGLDPSDIVFDGTGNLYFLNHFFPGVTTTKKISPDGTITDVPGTTESFFSLSSVSGSLFLSKISEVYRTLPGSSALAKIAGLPDAGFSGDGGAAKMASLTSTGLAASLSGDVFIADRSNDVIRKLTPVPEGSAALSASQPGLYLRTSGTTQTPLDVILDGNGTFTWTATANVTTPSGGSWLSLNQTNGTGNTTLTVTVDSAGLIAGSYNGRITISSPQAVNGSIVVPVTLTVLGPTVSSITPNTGVAGTSVNVTFNGSGFVPGSTVLEISESGGGLSTVVTATSVNVISATLLTATFNVDPAAIPGDRAVRVLTPHGSSAIGAFTVIANPTFASISGFVRWGSQPVAGSRVELHQSDLNSPLLASTVSAADGSFSFFNAPTGNMNIFAFAPSSEFWSFIGHSIQVSPGQHIEDFKLQLSKFLQLLQPENNSTVSTLTPTLSWQAFPGATTYHVQLNERATDQLIVSAGTTSTTMVTPALTDGKSYRWSVDAIDADGIRIAYYSEWYFTVTLIPAALPTTGYLISTIAGSANIVENGLAVDQPISRMADVAIDASGNLYIPSISRHKVFKVATDGTLTTFAGTGIPGPAGDGGLATAAQLRGPQSVTFDASGNLYIADSANHRIRRVAKDGTISTVAGTGESGVGQSGPALLTPLANPAGLVFDASGNLYLADLDAYRILKLDARGNITTVAGNGSPGFSGDGGPATSAQLTLRQDLVTVIRLGIDASGNLLIPDNNRVRKVTPDGVITTIAGTGEGGNEGDGGAAVSATLLLPTAVVPGPGGVLYVTSLVKIRKILPDGTIESLSAGSFFNFAGGMTIDQNGNLVLPINRGYQVSRITPEGMVTHLAGRFQGFEGDSGPALAARLYAPTGLAVGPTGNLFIADSFNNRIRKIDPGGNITTIAGNGTAGSTADGVPALSTGIGYAVGIAVDQFENVYFTSVSDFKVRKIATDGTLSTVAGTGSLGFSGDGGPATSAQLSNANGIAVDFAGNIYIADTGNRRVRKVSALDGNITTIAGTGSQGCDGYGGPATAARLSAPVDLAVDNTGNLYVADLHCRQIIKIDTNSIISPVPGSAGLGLAVATGSLFAANFSQIARLLSTGDVAAIAGLASSLGELFGEFSGDGGPAKMAGLYVSKLAANTTGALFASDGLSDVIRKLTPVPEGSAALSVSQSGLYLRTSGTTQTPLKLSLDGNGTFSWTATASVITPSGGSWLSLNQTSGTGNSTLAVMADAAGLTAGSYNGTITISSPQAVDASIVVPVTLTVLGPVITSVTPTSVRRGTTNIQLQINGINLAGATVQFRRDGVVTSAISLSGISASNTQIAGTLVVPNASSANSSADGPYTIVTISPVGTSNSVGFNLLPPPTIRSISTTGASPGVTYLEIVRDSSVSITATGESLQGASSLRFQCVPTSCNSSIQSIDTPSITQDGTVASASFNIPADTPLGRYFVHPSIPNTGSLSFASVQIKSAAEALITLAVGSGNGQIGSVNQPLSNPLVVTVQENGLPVSGMPVTFAATTGGGSVRTVGSTTNAATVTVFTGTDGKASATGVLGPNVGGQAFTATLRDSLGNTIATTTFSATAVDQTTSALVAYYRFNGNANDESSNANHGTAIGGVNFVAGGVEQAANFDGSTGYISVPDSPSLRLSRFTLTAWINPSVFDGGNRILEKGNSNSYYFDVNQNGRVIVGFYDGAFHDLVSPSSLQANTWNFVVGTYDGDFLRLFVNGALVGSMALSSAPLQTSEPLIIGWKFNGIASDHFAGLIDEVRIYNGALSESQIQQQFGFSFAVDGLAVDGNVNTSGNPDGVPDFLDQFDDGSLTNPPTSQISCAGTTVSESGGFLNLSSADGANRFTPGSLVDNCNLGGTYRLNEGAGSAVIIASFRADVPLAGQAYGLQLFTAGTSELVSVVVGSGPGIAAIVRSASGSQTVQSVGVNLSGVQRILLRLTFDDATNRVTQSFSTDGGASFTTINVAQPGTVMTSGSQGVVSVFGSVQTYSPGASKLTFIVPPSNATSGAAISPPVQVAVQNASGTLLGNATTSITLSLASNPAGGRLSGTVTANAVNGIATFSNLSIDKAGSGYTLRAVPAPTILRFDELPLQPVNHLSVTGVTFGFKVGGVDSIDANYNSFGPSETAFVQDPSLEGNAAGILTLDFTTPTRNLSFGVAMSTSAATSGLTVQLFDNNLSSLGTTTVNIAPRDGFFFSDGTFFYSGAAAVRRAIVDFDESIAPRFALDNLMFDSANSGGITGSVSGAFNINAGPASKLEFSTQPSLSAKGSPITPPLRVVVQDAAGNTVTSATNNITIAFATNPSEAVLSGTTTIAAVNGVATFSDLSINREGTGYALRASATGLTPATSATFDVAARPTLTSVNPSSGRRGVTLDVVLSGTGFVTGATAVVFSGTGVTATAINVTSSTSLSATLSIDSAAALGSRGLSVVTSLGSSNTLPFIVTSNGMNYGAIISGSLDSIGEEDKYNFDGGNGDRILVRLTSAFVPRVRILRPNGTQLCATDGSVFNFLQLECALDQAGTYAVAVTDRNFSQIGDYTFSLNKLNPPAGASPITYGQLVSGTHSPIAEVDFHTFTGAVGERVFLRMTSAFVPAVGIRRPDGTQLCATDGSVFNFLQLECALDQAGTYAVAVTDRNFSQTGDYTFFLNKLNPPAGASPITYGGTVTGTHDPPAEVDSYTFTAAMGDRISIQLTSAFLPLVSVRRADGTQLCSGDNAFAGTLSLNCVADRDGTHAILVTDRNFNQVGAYQMTLSPAP